MKKLCLLALLIGAATSLYASDYEKLTSLLHHEEASHVIPNVNEKTHPVLYSMVQDIAQRAQVPMPRYITLFNAEYAVVTDQGVVARQVHHLNAYVDILGDLYICRELIAHLSYQELEGVVAVALSEKAVNKPLKMLGVGVATWAATVAMIRMLDNYYQWSSNSNIATGVVASQTYHAHPNFTLRASISRRTDLMVNACFGAIIPAAFAAGVYGNHLQETIDREAVKVTDVHNIINGIAGAEKITDAYEKENIFVRLAGALGIKEAIKTIFYPVRAYSPEERIAYLQKAAHNR